MYATWSSSVHVWRDEETNRLYDDATGCTLPGGQFAEVRLEGRFVVEVIRLLDHCGYAAFK